MQSIHPIVHPRPPLLWLPTLLSLSTSPLCRLTVAPLRRLAREPVRSQTPFLSGLLASAAFKVSNPLESAIPDRFDLPPFASLNIHRFPVLDHGCNTSTAATQNQSFLFFPFPFFLFRGWKFSFVRSFDSSLFFETWNRNFCKKFCERIGFIEE